MSGKSILPYEEIKSLISQGLNQSEVAKRIRYPDGTTTTRQAIHAFLLRHDYIRNVYEKMQKQKKKQPSEEKKKASYKREKLRAAERRNKMLEEMIENEKIRILQENNDLQSLIEAEAIYKNRRIKYISLSRVFDIINCYHLGFRKKQAAWLNGVAWMTVDRVWMSAGYKKAKSDVASYVNPPQLPANLSEDQRKDILYLVPKVGYNRTSRILGISLKAVTSFANNNDIYSPISSGAQNREVSERIERECELFLNNGRAEALQKAAS